jgi:protein O-mannosyl-transferase
MNRRFSVLFYFYPVNLQQLSEKRPFVYTVLVAVPLLVFFKCVYFEFTLMDEQWLIMDRKAGYEHWSGLTDLFRAPILSMFYRPILTASFLLDYQLGGLDTRIYHLSNVVYHLLCVLMLFRLLKYLGNENLSSLLLCLVFAVHPMVVHAVAWVPGRNDTLLCLFSLLSLYGLLRYVKDGRLQGLLLHLAAFVLALLTKESAVSLLVVFAVAWFIYGKADRKLLMTAILLAGMTTLWYLLKRSIVDFQMHHREISENAVDFFKATMVYLGKTVLPVRQWIMPTLENSVWYTGLIAVAFFATLAIIFGLRNRRIAATGLIILLSLLALPVWFSLSSNQGEIYEHRFYLPLAGIMIFTSQLKFGYHKTAVQLTFLLLIAVFSFLSWQRTEAYRSAMSYADEGIRCCPDRYAFYVHKGYALSDEGRFLEAIPNYSKAIELMPRNYKIYMNRSACYAELGMRNEALRDLDAAQRINYKPEILIARHQVFMKFGERDNARREQEAINAYYGANMERMSPQDIRHHNEDQLEELNRLIAAQPRNALLYVNRARIYMDLRRGREALDDLKTANELEPANSEYKRYYEELSHSLPH